MEATTAPATEPEDTDLVAAVGAGRRGFIEHMLANGRFCRDTPLGGVLHPGVVSFREITDGDSLHVCIDGDDRISAHVDRFSPVAGARPDGCCRYSVRAVATHLAAHLVAQARQLARGARGRHRCRLTCEQVDADRDPADDAGACPTADGTG